MGTRNEFSSLQMIWTNVNIGKRPIRSRDSARDLWVTRHSRKSMQRGSERRTWWKESTRNLSRKPKFWGPFQWRVTPQACWIHLDGHQRRVGDWQKIFDDERGMIKQGDRAQTKYRKSETLPDTRNHRRYSRRISRTGSGVRSPGTMWLLQRYLTGFFTTARRWTLKAIVIAWRNDGGRGFFHTLCQDDFRYHYLIKCTLLFRLICTLLHRRWHILIIGKIIFD